MKTERTYKLHKNQHLVYGDSARFIVLAAGRRFGKTILSVINLITHAAQKPNSTCWYICPTYKQAEMIAWKMLKTAVPEEVLLKKPNEVKLEVVLKNGSTICLKGADNEDSLRGVGLQYVVLDEFSTMKQNVWQEIIRPALSDTRGKALFIGTPKGKNHFWELWMRGMRKEDGYSSYQFTTYDNPFIPKSEIEEAKTQLNDRYFKQEYMASFEDYTGLIWPEFRESEHVIEAFQIPEEYEKYAALDPAMTGTTGVLACAVDYEGTVFITKEFYEQNKRASEVSDSVRGWSETWFGDPSGKRKTVSRDGTLFSLFDEYADNGIHLIAAQNDVNAGINRVAEYFKQGKIKIFNNCRNLVEELLLYHWADERETVLGVSEPKPFKSRDHLCDCLRYLIMSRPESAHKIKKVPYEVAVEMVFDPFIEQPVAKQEDVPGIDE